MIKNDHGFSLIELLICLSISLFLLGFLFQMIISTRNSYRLERELSTIEENAHLASFYLHQSIGLAGSIGCGKLSPTFPVIDLGARVFDVISYDNRLDAYEAVHGSWQPLLPKDFDLHPKLGTDVIAVRYVSPLAARLQHEVAHGSRIVVTAKPEIQADDDIALSNCLALTLFHVNRVSKYHDEQEIYLTRNVPQVFAKDTEVGILKTEIFFIQSTKRLDLSGKLVDSLFVMNESGQKSELISNIVDMYIECFEEESKNHYVIKRPSQVANWGNIRLVRLNLLLRSESELLKTPKPYWFRGQSYLPSDLYFYQPFIITIALKN